MTGRSAAGAGAVSRATSMSYSRPSPVAGRHAGESSGSKDLDSGEDAWVGGLALATRTRAAL